MNRTDIIKATNRSDILDSPPVLFDFRVNMMLNDFIGVIQDNIGDPRIWRGANHNTLTCLKNLDEAIADLNKVTEDNLDAAGLTVKGKS